MSMFAIERAHPRVCTNEQLLVFKKIVNNFAPTSRNMFKEIYAYGGKKYHCMKEYGVETVFVILEKIEMDNKDI